MTSPVATAPVVDALRRAGLLVGIEGPLPALCEGLCDDSRQVQHGALFLAVRGSTRDGHDFLAAARSRGAVAALVEDASATGLPRIVVRAGSGRVAAAVAAATAFGNPAQHLTLVAVTGTNGKTTTVGMLRHLLDAPGETAASIGTLGVLVGSEGRPLPGGEGLTTPGPVELQRVLRALVSAGVGRVVMEVSSHSLDQRRVEGLCFAAAIFTNLTRDHLDYHGSMEAYGAAKAGLVGHLAADGVAVVNADDPAWAALPPAPRRVTYGLASSAADVRARNVRMTPQGSAWELVTPGGSAPVSLPLIGDFNVANALGAGAAAWALGVAPRVIGERLATLPQVPGRLERVSDTPVVLRDYAHTPDSLERALIAVRPFVAGRLFVVFGCGGDRDPGKRPMMGGIAERLADVVILTSDNPRTEDPEAILDQVEAGMRGDAHRRIEDRRAAIAYALRIAAPGDLVLLAGKGHETYQIRGTVKHPFDERLIVHELLSAPRGSGA